MKELKGVLTALITPFTPDLKIDEEGLGVLVERQLKAGIGGICSIVGSGEYVNMSDAERARVLELTVKYVNGRAPVLAGVFEACTGRAVEMARMAEAKGADALVVLTPYYNKPSVEGLKLYFESVAESVNIPLIIYNNPGRSPFDLSGMYKHFAGIRNVAGVKECCRDMGVFSETITSMSGVWKSLLCGDDDILLPMLSLGADGAVLTTTNIAPARWVELFNAMKKGDLATARTIHFDLMPLVNAVYTLNHPALVKKCMDMMGLPAGTTRSPLLPPTPEQVARIAKVIETVDLR